MLSSTPKNRKRRVRRKKNKLDQWDASAKPARKSRKPETPADTYQKLHAQIGAIESFLEKRQRAEAQKLQMRQQNILPPPDGLKKKRTRRAMSLAEKRRYNATRNRNGIKFLFLFCLACGIAWWLIFAGI